MPRLQIMDTTIRDGQQSLWATRMQIGDMLPILPKMDRVGYWAIEAWGGATFDTCLRFLDENPWERLRSIKAHMPNTDLAMLSRGQVVSKVWEYIRANNLQNPNDKRVINADAKLKAIFGKDSCTMFEMNKFLAAHLK